MILSLQWSISYKNNYRTYLLNISMMTQNPSSKQTRSFPITASFEDRGGGKPNLAPYMDAFLYCETRGLITFLFSITSRGAYAVRLLRQNCFRLADYNNNCWRGKELEFSSVDLIVWYPCVCYLFVLSRQNRSICSSQSRDSHPCKLVTSLFLGKR